MNGLDAWLTTDPRDAEQAQYERWYEDNDDQMEGLNPTDIETLYENFLEGLYVDEEYRDSDPDEDDYPF